MIKSLVLIFLGGGLGSISRFLLGRWINNHYANPFPLATLTINVVACFVLGCVVGLADQKQLISAASRLFWVVGFCGGFSTFSTFSNESLLLLQSGLTLTMASYIILSVALCLAATFLGLYLASNF